jgi:hypothetical protein
MAALLALTMALGGAGAAFGESGPPPKFKGNDTKCQDPSSGKTNPNCPGPVRSR